MEQPQTPQEPAKSNPFVDAVVQEMEQQMLIMARRSTNFALEKAGMLEIGKNMKKRAEEAEARAAALQAELDALKEAATAPAESCPNNDEGKSQ